MRLINVRADDTLHEQVAVAARIARLSKSEWLRQVIEAAASAEISDRQESLRRYQQGLGPTRPATTGAHAGNGTGPTSTQLRGRVNGAHLGLQEHPRPTGCHHPAHLKEERVMGVYCMACGVRLEG